MRAHVYPLDAVRLFAALSVMFCHLSFYSWASKDSVVGHMLNHATAFPAATPFTSWGWVGVEIFFVISILFLITIVAFYKLTITIDGEILCASFGVGLVRKNVALAEITACEPIRTRWWYGWGIHLMPYGWLYNVSGLGAVAITLRDGRRFALGTDDPDGLVAAIGVS